MAWLVSALVAIAVGAAVCAVPAAANGGGSTGPACAAQGSRTIVRSSSARVFRLNGRAYGCLYSRNRRVRLEARPEDEPGGFSDTSLVGPRPVLAGRFVGYAYSWDSGASGGDGIAITDLRRGEQTNGVEFDPGFEEDHPAVNVHDLVVTTRGSIAWTWTASFELVENRPPVREVRKLEPRDRAFFGVLLDSGPEIDVLSLRRSGSSRVSWLKAGQRVSAPLR